MHSFISMLAIASLLMGCGDGPATPSTKDAAQTEQVAPEPAPAPKKSGEPIIPLKIDGHGRMSFWGPLSKFERAEGWVHEDVLDLPHSDDGAQCLLHTLRKLTDEKPRLGDKPGAPSDATLRVLLDPDAPFAATYLLLALCERPEVRLTRFWFRTSESDEGVRLDVTRHGYKETRAEVVATVGPSSKPDKIRLALGPMPVQQTHLMARTPAEYQATWKQTFSSWQQQHSQGVPAAEHRLRLRVEGDVPAWTVVRLLRAAQDHGLWDLRLHPVPQLTAPGFRPPIDGSDDAPRPWPEPVIDPTIRLRLHRKGRLEHIEEDGLTLLRREATDGVSEFVVGWTFAASGTLTFDLEVTPDTKERAVAVTLGALRAQLENIKADDVPRGRGLRSIRIVRRPQGGSEAQLVLDHPVERPPDNVLRLLFDEQGRLHVLAEDGTLRALGALDGTAAKTTMARLRAEAVAWTKSGRLQVDVEIEPGTPQVLADWVDPTRLQLLSKNGVRRFTRHVGPDGESVTEQFK